MQHNYYNKPNRRLQIETDEEVKTDNNSVIGTGTRDIKIVF